MLFKGFLNRINLLKCRFLYVFSYKKVSKKLNSKYIKIKNKNVYQYKHFFITIVLFLFNMLYLFFDN